VSALTPDQWQALDRMQQRHQRLDPETVLAFTLAIPAHTAVYLATLTEHARTLIDTARTVRGVPRVRDPQADPPRDCGGHVPARRHLPRL